MTQSLSSENLKKIDQQRAFFEQGGTQSYAWRKTQLQQLQKFLSENEKILSQALQQDLGKNPLESYLSEIGFLHEEIKYTLKHLSHWMKPEDVPSPLALAPSRSFLYSVPYGQVLVFAPFNYPVQLALAPLISAWAAGNVAVLKPSEIVTATEKVLTEQLPQYFSAESLLVFNGGPELSEALLSQRFDFIFFTGSTKVGKIIAAQAASSLTPVCLELGGKSPALVDECANLEVSAKRIAWGKFLNAGQTCVAPDFVYVHKSKQKKFIEHLQNALVSLYGKDPKTSSDYGRIVSRSHFQRLMGLMDSGKLVWGGQSDLGTKYISPTLLTVQDFRSPLMQEEIFGPLLPILTFENFDEVIASLRAQPHPLALYYFGTNKNHEKLVLERLPFGGGCLNDCLMHLSNPHLPFGGVGTSGIGAYHGKHGFDLFSHKKAWVRAKTFLDIPLRYPPYTGFKEKLLRWILS